MERVARALAACAFRHGTPVDGDEPEDNWEAWEEEARAAIAAMPELTVQGWRDIETAPKDGTEIVLFDANVKTPAIGEWMIDVAWLNVGKKPGEAFAEPGWFPLETPTHWIPLPSPPVESSNG